MDEQQIKTGFSEGISLPEGQFTPIYYLSRVDEPEFGCEGRPEQGKIFGRAYGYDKNGFKINDPYSAYRSKKRWSFARLAGQIKAIWSYERSQSTTTLNPGAKG